MPCIRPCCLDEVLVLFDLLGDHRCAMEDKIDYYGNDLRNTRTNNEDECANECIDEPECMGFTFSQNRCYLKYNLSNRVIHDDAISDNCRGKDNLYKKNKIISPFIEYVYLAYLSVNHSTTKLLSFHSYT